MNSVRNLPNVNKASEVIFDMEPSLNDAANLSSALAMAIAGIGKLAIEPEHQSLALQALADEVRFAAHKSLDQWTQAYNLSAKEREASAG